MKKLFIYIVSAASIFAACNKEEITTPIVDLNTPVETEVITIDIATTKTSLNGMNTEWSSGDQVGVSVDGKQIGTLKLVEGTTFTGEIESGFAGDKVATINYPAGVTSVPTTQAATPNSFADEAALLEGKTTIADLREGNGASLQNKTALLQFTVAQAGDVTFEVGATKYTITGCKTGNTYYACVEPVSNASFVARIGGYLSKKASNNATFTANKLVDLKQLPAPVQSAWGLVGLNGDWSNDKVLYKDLDGYFVLKNVEIKSTDEFKLRKDKAWTTTLSGGITAPNTKRDGGWVNMTISEAGTYDVYTNGTHYYIMTPGKLPAEASAPGPIEITVTFDGDTNRNYIHIWSDGGEIANNKGCTSTKPFTWKVTVPAGDQQKRDYQFILKKGSGWGSYQTADSDKLCLRNPMPLKIANNKVTHK